MSAASDNAVDVLLRFGAVMLRAGGTAVRTRELMQAIAHKLNLEPQSIYLTPETIVISVRRAGESVTAARDVGPPAINAWRIGELDQLASIDGTATAIAQRLAEIESAPPHHPAVMIAALVGLATGAFAFLSGAALPEMLAAAFGGAIGQWVRSWLSRREFNQFGAAALSGMIALGSYILIAALAIRAGFRFSHYQAGFISTVLFLVPGFPLIAGLFDLIQHQTAAALSRIAYGILILLAVVSGLSIVIGVADIGLVRQPPFELAYPQILALRAVASFIAGCGFAMVFNSPARTLLIAGAIAMIANSLRLILIDVGMPLAPAAFLAALSIGLIALLMNRRFNVQIVAVARSADRNHDAGPAFLRNDRAIQPRSNVRSSSGSLCLRFRDLCFGNGPRRSSNCERSIRLGPLG